MKFLGKKLLVAAAMLAFTSMSAANAITCPDPIPADRYMTLDAAGTSCLASGTYSGGNKSEDQFLTLYSDYTLLGKSDGGGTPGFSATVGSLIAGTDGEVSWTPPGGYSAYAILFKFGQGDVEDAWFAFSLPSASGFVDAYWATYKSNGDPYTQHELSHASLFGIVAPVPVPAAGFLLLGGLGGLVALRRRKKA